MMVVAQRATYQCGSSQYRDGMAFKVKSSTDSNLVLHLISSNLSKSIITLLTERKCVVHPRINRSKQVVSIIEF